MPRFTYLNCERHVYKFPTSCGFFPEFHNVVYCTATRKCGIPTKRKSKRRKKNEKNNIS